MTTKPRVAIYARFSTDMQNPKSAEDQERECRKHADREGWSVTQVFQDTALSGATKGRPGYEALLSAVKAGQFDIVLFEHLDRLARDLEFLMAFYKEARHVECELHQLHRGKLGIFDIGILGTFAQIFLEELSYKTRRGLIGKIEAGKSAGGLSYGYSTRRTASGEVVKGELDLNTVETPIVERIFKEYAAGKSPIHIASSLNADGIPAPRGRGNSSGHWRQTTINGNHDRGTGILNNELYVGRRVWNRLRYSKHPETGKRVSRPNPAEDWIIFEDPALRVIEQSLWEAVKALQSEHKKVRSTKPATDKKGLSVGQSFRRRKYLLSGLMSCGQCGGNLTVAGSGKARRYYCANAKEKGASVCTGMRGLKEADAATSILSGLKTGLMQDEAYADFRDRFLARTKAQEEERGKMLKMHNQNIRQLENKIANIVRSVEDGDAPTSLKKRLKELETDLEAACIKRDAFTPEPITLPPDLPAFYRAHIEDLIGTLSDEDVAGRASDELHGWIDTVVVDWDAEAKVHRLELRGELLKMLNATRPAGDAGLVECESSLKLVAGVGFEPTTFRL